MDYKLIAGLGNPGPEYEATRHNAGFLALDLLADELGARYWKNESGALVAHVQHGGEELLLVKPQAYMNTSGGPISKLAAAYKIAPAELLVIHDEMDLEPGTIRVKVGGGPRWPPTASSRSMPDSGAMRTRACAWARGTRPGRKSVTDFVLQVPKGAEAESFEHAVALAADAALCAIDEGATTAMNRYN